MEHQKELSTNIVSIIHNRSDSGQLVRAEEILTELHGQGLLESEDIDHKTHLATLLKQVLQENRDLREISGPNGIAYYHSVQSLSETYAGILVWKLENPLWLIAEVVRNSSQLYPRPVSADSFREPPFDLTREEIEECLTTMGEQEEYQDISRTITSVGTKFLYSTRHLDPDQAVTLAEWLDVGQVNNP
jgi:hypothetical protein